MRADDGRTAGWPKAERYIEKEVDLVSFNKVTRVIAGIAATALLIPMAACGGGSSQSSHVPVHTGQSRHFVFSLL